MFRKKDTETELDRRGEGVPPTRRERARLRATELPRRKVDLPAGRAGTALAGAAQPAEQHAAEASSPEPDRYSGKRLIVGQGIRLSGEISSCDRLVVEGEVEVTLNDTLRPRDRRARAASPAAARSRKPTSAASTRAT